MQSMFVRVISFLFVVKIQRLLLTLSNWEKLLEN